MTGAVSPLTAGLHCRCPRCGEGPLFQGFLSVREACPICGLDLRAQDSGDGPAALIILVVGFIVMGAALTAEIRYAWPVWLHLLLWLPLTALLIAAVLRPSKALMIALQYRVRAGDFNSDP